MLGGFVGFGAGWKPLHAYKTEASTELKEPVAERIKICIESIIASRYVEIGDNF